MWEPCSLLHSLLQAAAFICSKQGCCTLDKEACILRSIGHRPDADMLAHERQTLLFLCPQQQTVTINRHNRVTIDRKPLVAETGRGQALAGA